MEEDIIFDDNFKRMNNKNIHLYCTHALCHEGEASFLLAEKSFHMKQGDCIILPHSSRSIPADAGNHIEIYISETE